MANYVYYHNPRCTKSRQGLVFLEENNIAVDIKEYLKVPLTKSEIVQLFDALAFTSALDMIRVKEKEYIEAGLTKSSTNDDIFNAIVAYPKLLERPILISGNAAAIGRPTENLQKLLAN
jgi:arsenate reductase (glutaredoxin)